MGIITEFNSQMYSDMIMPLVQQQGSLLLPSVTVEYGFTEGQYKWIEQMGQIDFNTTTNRLGSTNWEEIDAYSRRVTKQAFEKNLILDRNESMDRIVDPMSAISQGIIYGAGRKMDEVIVSALGGSAYQGKQSTSSVTLASYDSSSHVVTESGTDGLTLAKLTAIRKLFMAANVPANEKLTIVMGPQQWADAMAVLQITSSDYNSQRVLSQGAMGTFLGFDFVVYNGLTLASNKRTCFAYAKSGLRMCIANDLESHVDEKLPEHKHHKGFSAYLGMGATRTQEAMVISFDCYEA
jgi:hypothetical protein